MADTSRNDTQDAQGCVAAVVFPDASPPFFPRGVLMSGPPRPDEYARRRAGVHALNRWMVDFCAFFPVRRAGVGSVLLNDLDDTLTDVAWIAEHGLRGGVFERFPRLRVALSEVPLGVLTSPVGLLDVATHRAERRPGCVVRLRRGGAAG